MSAIQHIHNNTLQRNRSAGKPLSQVRTDAVIYEKFRPAIKPIRSKETLPNGRFFDALTDAGLTLRTIPVAISEITGHSLDHNGAPMIGLTSVLYCGIGVGRARDSFRQASDLEKVGDLTGANLARKQIVENTFLVGGSVALAVLRIFGTIQELFGLLKHPLILPAAMVTAQTVAAWVSTALYVVFYGVFIWRQANILGYFSEGNDLREKLLNSKDPIRALREFIDLEMYKGGGFTADECTEMALQEGAKWLEKLEKETKDVSWEPTEESRRAHALELFLSNPEFMMAEMGVPTGINKMTPEGRVVRFGRFIGEKRLSLKIENELKRQLGTEAMEAFNQVSPDRAAFEKALKSATWSEWGVRWKTVLKICLAVASTAAILAGTFFTGGLVIGIALLVLGVVGLVWLALADGAAFKSQWESGEVSKWDKFIVALSVVLSVVSISVLVTLAILSGGAIFYIAGIIFALGWMVINARAGYAVIDKGNSPWKYQKVVTAVAFRKFLETKPTEEEIQKIWDKMSVGDQEGIEEEMVDQHDLLKAAAAWEEHLQELREESLDVLMDSLKEASEVVRKLPVAN